MYINIESFISEHVIKRSESMFLQDIEDNKQKLIDKIKNKSILVIGGAGSIGSSFIKAVLPFRPRTLIVVDINENGLAELTRDLRSIPGMYIPEDYIPYPMDYNSEAFRKMFTARSGFDIVANFSAHKHVRSEKDIYSIEAMLKNNVINAKRLLDLLGKYPPEEYFCVSTDKAANPVNIMGASKRIMEDVIFAYSDKYPVKTARFANVAFSNGSLPAGFLERIQKLQPISAPSDVRRYFVSPEESGQICMLSCMLGNNREIFYPQLRENQMARFDTIAEDLLIAQGYEVLKCDSDEEAIEKSIDLKNGSNKYPVHFSGSDTSGEKAYEEFYTENEAVDDKRFKSLGVIVGKELTDISIISEFVNRLNSLFDEADINSSSNSSSVTKADVVAIIKDYLPGFEHIEKGKSLDAKM